jgi:hypothetical protein
VSVLGSRRQIQASLRRGLFIDEMKSIFLVLVILTALAIGSMAPFSTREKSCAVCCREGNELANARQNTNTNLGSDLTPLNTHYSVVPFSSWLEGGGYTGLENVGTFR